MLKLSMCVDTYEGEEKHFNVIRDASEPDGRLQIIFLLLPTKCLLSENSTATFSLSRVCNSILNINEIREVANSFCHQAVVYFSAAAD